MPTEGFFQRWSRLKTEPAPTDRPGTAAREPALPDAPAGVTGRMPSSAAGQGAQSAGEAAPARQPTLEDVALLGADADYSAFVARGVDKEVQRSAMKKLFSDPHFNIGDGLDLYMGDYNRPDPIPAAMLAALRHSQSFFAQAFPEKESADEHDEAKASLADPEKPVDPGEPAPPTADNTGADGAASEDSA